MSELKAYARQILDSFRKKILEYFDSIKSEKNLAIVDYIESVQVQKAQFQEFTIGIPLEKGKKVDFGIEVVEYEMPTLAIVKFKNFPLNEVIIRIAFPATLFGPKGEYPKIIFTSTLKQPWPGEFGLVWAPITGNMDAFAFHPYQNKENKMEDLTKFYSENIVDPLCDFLNTGKYKVAIKLRENLKKFLASKDIEVWNYQNPFKKKDELITIELPIYCEFFDENDASILYVECYSLKNYWIPPAYIIYDIMQYIGLATEMFDPDGKLLSEDKLQHVAATLEKIESTSEEVEKTKRLISLKEEWDPFKPVKATKRDALGYAVGDQEEGVSGAEHRSVIEKVERMKALMQQRASVEVEQLVPPVLERPASPKEEQQVEPPRPQPTSVLESKAFQFPVSKPEPSLSSLLTPKPEPQFAPSITTKTSSQPTAPSVPKYEPKPPSIQFENEPSQMNSQTAPSTEFKPRLRGDRLKSASSAEFQPPIATAAPASAAHAPLPVVAKPAAAPTIISPKEFFQEFQMRQFVMVGNGSDLPFKLRGDFKMLQMLTSPFILSFARDQVRIKKSITSMDAVEVLFEFYKTGHMRVI